ncbi:hypothetical protein B0H21DRAFT_234312 [Amylocystis lapponica]|nr:hypothetical protein B0H21DRAFT_234312 [Amylocystis lapponica]
MFMDAFVASRSRVVLLFDMWPCASVALATVFGAATGRPRSLWVLGEDGAESAVWAVFDTHQQAAAVLSRSFPSLAVAPALDHHLRVLQHHLRPLRLLPAPPPKSAHPDTPLDLLVAPFTAPASSAPSRAQPSPTTRMCMRDAPPPSHLYSDAAGAYTLSSNPPNPRTSFRSGDWICAVAPCAAHNFGRNVICRICGSPRSAGLPMNCELLPFDFMQMQLNATVSPRFVAAAAPLSARADTCRFPLPLGPPLPPQRTSSLPVSLPSARLPSPPPTPQKLTGPSYPLLTPSGHALSVGGRVQNVSTDPLSPCVMYWPDNEPLPAQGQIRPASSAVSYPPIINTGNKGAAEKQPGDWICQTCHYLNWRRRKVCQTCFPYAEGNGDSISAAVQAERIALLENVLAAEMHELARKGDSWHPTGLPTASRTSSPLPLLPSTAHSFALPRPPVGTHDFSAAPDQWLRTLPSDIKEPQTPAFTVRPPFAPAPEAPLLPAFLQDMVQSPSLSPATSTSASELSLDDGGAFYGAHAHSGSTSSFGLGLRKDSIWRLGGDESRILGGASAGAGVSAYASSSGSSPADSARREL